MVRIAAGTAAGGGSFLRLLPLVVFAFLVLPTFSCNEDPGDSPAQLPDEDGKVLFEFLLANAPDAVLKVPCSCCGEELRWCYEGGCPYT